MPDPIRCLAVVRMRKQTAAWWSGKKGYQCSVAAQRAGLPLSPRPRGTPGRRLSVHLKRSSTVILCLWSTWLSASTAVCCGLSRPSYGGGSSLCLLCRLEYIVVEASQVGEALFLALYRSPSLPPFLPLSFIFLLMSSLPPLSYYVPIP